MPKPREGMLPYTAAQIARLWAGAERVGSCLVRTGSIGPKGYAQLHLGFDGRRVHVYAHRMAYEVTYGPIPDGLEVDHVKTAGCRSRACIEPSHLEAVPGAENNARSDSLSAIAARRSECAKGHPLTGANLYRWNGERKCRRCSAEWARNRRTRRTLALSI